jgi:glucan phosphoethanolaminetransferase (alkaline phosphatase superfamily)
VSSLSLLKAELSPTFGAERRQWISALLFVTGLFVFEGFYFHESLTADLAALWQGSDVVGLTAFPIYFAASAYLFFLFVLAAISSKWPFRIFYLAIFGFAILAEYSYHRALGRFTNFYDIIAALSATDEQKSDSILAFINLIAFVPIAASAFLSMRLRSAKQFGWKMLIGLIVASSLFYLQFSMLKGQVFASGFPNNSFAIFLTTLSDYAVQTPFQRLGPIVREPVAPINDLTAPKNNVIVVFDESIRADHLSLNGYERQTTPFLSELGRKQLLLNWGTAAAAATSSHPSYDAFITGAQPNELETQDLRQLNSRPTLFQYAKAMGYRTILIDGQMMNYWGGVPDDLNYIDEFDPLSVVDRPDRIEDWQTASNTITDESKRTVGLKQWQIDERIAEMVNKIFTRSTGNFIFVYKRGCHFPYEKNFPPIDTIWKPIYHFQTQYEVPPADQVQGVINSYDNSLRYNLDEFFKKLAPDYSSLPNNTVIIYTGDHGESFYANGRAGHGGDTVDEARVPLFILGLKTADLDISFHASHHNLFATVLDLIEYPEDLRPQYYSVSLLKATSRDSAARFFNPYPGKKIPFD